MAKSLQQDGTGLRQLWRENWETITAGVLAVAAVAAVLLPVWSGATWPVKVATMLAAAMTGGALVLAFLIWRLTSKEDADRHRELLDALAGLPEDDLSAMEAHLRDALRGALAVREHVVRAWQPKRDGPGNRPWRAVTSTGRVLRIYSGGRAGGVHVTELEPGLGDAGDSRQGVVTE